MLLSYRKSSLLSRSLCDQMKYKNSDQPSQSWHFWHFSNILRLSGMNNLNNLSYLTHSTVDSLKHDGRHTEICPRIAVFHISVFGKDMITKKRWIHEIYDICREFSTLTRSSDCKWEAIGKRNEWLELLEGRNVGGWGIAERWECISPNNFEGKCVDRKLNRAPTIRTTQCFMTWKTNTKRAGERERQRKYHISVLN